MKSLVQFVLENKAKDDESESYKEQYERRVVETDKEDHLKQGYKWRIKGKEKDEHTVKLYKTKPDYDEFVKQLERVAAYEFGS